MKHSSCAYGLKVLIAQKCCTVDKLFTPAEVDYADKWGIMCHAQIEYHDILWINKKNEEFQILFDKEDHVFYPRF